VSKHCVLLLLQASEAHLSITGKVAELYPQNQGI